MAAGVSAGAVEQQHGMRPSGHGAGDLVQVELHGFSVGIRQGQGRACAPGRTDGAKQIGAVVALIGRLARA